MWTSTEPVTNESGQFSRNRKVPQLLPQPLRGPGSPAEKLANLHASDSGRHARNVESAIGSSRKYRTALDMALTVAPLDTTVLIQGETGTGKELMARAIHRCSSRRERAFVKFNCAAIPPGLLESELFGHERGAFTGAIQRRIGRFEAADRGSVFLDEIGDFCVDLQAKLLRVLQEGELERLGGGQTLRVNVRMIAATNQDLAALVSNGRFRSDLYYRLNVFPITVPPLRERPEDIVPLVLHFVRTFARFMNREIAEIPEETLQALCDYPWPGNIRELQNFIERSVILSSGPVLCAPLKDLKRATTSVAGIPVTLRDAERQHICKALEQTKWVVAGPRGAAARLGIKRSTLYFRMKKLGISPSRKEPLTASGA